jgi:hypothetical protein
MVLYITIDAEEDDWGEYRTGGCTTNNIEQISLLQKIFDRYGAVPTYLISYAVAKDRRAVDILSNIVDQGKGEIGAHCHPWNTPPFEEKLDSYHSMLCNLHPDLVEKKIYNLHRGICSAFKKAPLCFRAGRWGFGPAAAKAIYSLGYEVDTSVTPFVDWTIQGGPNFSESPHDIYRFNPKDILSMQQDGSLLEVPPTIGFYQRGKKLCSFIRRKILAGHLAQWKLIGLLEWLNIVNFRWLSPELSDDREMIRLASNQSRKISSLNMSFHSTTLLPGASPFVRNEDELRAFLKRIEGFLQFAAKQGFAFAPLSNALKLYPKTPSPFTVDRSPGY